jgi:hypothetical protein
MLLCSSEISEPWYLVRVPMRLNTRDTLLCSASRIRELSGTSILKDDILCHFWSSFIETLQALHRVHGPI